MRIEGIRYNDGSGNAVVDIHVASTSELPVMGAAIGMNMNIRPTSIACTKDGTFYKLHDDGKWYKQDGSGDSVTPSEG